MLGHYNEITCFSPAYSTRMHAGRWVHLIFYLLSLNLSLRNQKCNNNILSVCNDKLQYAISLTCGLQVSVCNTCFLSKRNPKPKLQHKLVYRILYTGLIYTQPVYCITYYNHFYFTYYTYCVISAKSQSVHVRTMHK